MIMVDCGSCAGRNFFPYIRYWNCPLDIFITHMHPDHWVGLLEILPIFAILGRTEEINVWCEVETAKMLDTIFSTPMYSKTPFELTTRAMDEKYTWAKNLQKYKVELRCKEADHSVPTLAFRLDFQQYYSHTPKGGEPEQFSIGFGADTQPTSRLENFFKKVDYLIWEATYLHSLKHLARKSKHSTSLEAAYMALNSEAKFLFMNHISYHTDPALQLAEAREIFPSLEIPNDEDVKILDKPGLFSAIGMLNNLYNITKAHQQYTNMWPPPSSY